MTLASSEQPTSLVSAYQPTNLPGSCLKASAPCAFACIHLHFGKFAIFGSFSLSFPECFMLLLFPRTHLTLGSVQMASPDLFPFLLLLQTNPSLAYTLTFPKRPLVEMMLNILSLIISCVFAGRGKMHGEKRSKNSHGYR